MKWFEGEIAEAIAESRKNKALFVVNIQHPPEDNDPRSQQMARYWDMVDNRTFTPALIGIRIFAGTEPAKQFAHIYPVPIVPASYFIDLKGKPLDVISIIDYLDEDVFFQRLKMVMKMFNAGDQPSSSSAVAENKPVVQNGDETRDLKNLSAEEKITRARELLEKKRAEDELAKKNEEQRKEIERRNLVKQMAEAKISREERERREIAEQRKREKREQEAYLKRLREQIKADKEERMNGPRHIIAEAKHKAKPVEPQGSMHSSVSNSSECRIQCKFPDGSTLIYNFASTDLFTHLKDAIIEDGRFGEDFYLVQMYPRREFPDPTLTFAELGLTPSATILVVSKRKRTVTTYGASRWLELLQYAIVAPFQALYRILLYLVGYGGGGSVSTSSKGINSGNARTVPNKTRITGNSNGRQHHSHVRQEGNLRRFHNEEDSSHSDDEATWNGNSTQQL